MKDDILHQKSTRFNSLHITARGLALHCQYANTLVIPSLLVTFTALEAYPNLVADRLGTKFNLEGNRLTEAIVKLKVLGEKLLVSERSSITEKLAMCYRDLDSEFSKITNYEFGGDIHLLKDLRNRLTHPKAELHGEMKSDEATGEMQISSVWKGDSLWKRLVEHEVLRPPQGWEESLHLTNSLTAQPKCAVWAFNSVTAAVAKVDALVAATLGSRIPKSLFLPGIAERIHSVDAEAAKLHLNVAFLRHTFSV